MSGADLKSRSDRSESLAVMLAWMAVIFFFSSMHGAAVPDRMPWWVLLGRKGAHVSEYLVLTGLSFRFFRSWFPALRPGMVPFLSAVLSLAYAFSDEAHQMFVPGREGKLSDIGIDAIGIAFGIFAVSRIARIVPRRRY